jgi:hypothetical protein
MYIVIFLFIDIILMSIEVLEKKDKNIEQYIDPEHKVNIIKQGKWTVWEFLSNFGIFEERHEEVKEEKRFEEIKERKKSVEAREEKELEEGKWEKKLEDKNEREKIEQKDWWFFKKLFSRNKKNDEKDENKDWEQKESSFEKENLTKDKKEKPGFFAGLRKIVKNVKEIAKDWKTEWKLRWKELKKSESNEGTLESKNPNQKLLDGFANGHSVKSVEYNKTIRPIELLKNAKEINEESPDTGKNDVRIFGQKENPDEKFQEKKE